MWIGFAQISYPRRFHTVTNVGVVVILQVVYANVNDGERLGKLFLAAAVSIAPQIEN